MDMTLFINKYLPHMFFEHLSTFEYFFTVDTHEFF